MCAFLRRSFSAHLTLTWKRKGTAKVQTMRQRCWDEDGRKTRSLSLSIALFKPLQLDGFRSYLIEIILHLARLTM